MTILTGSRREFLAAGITGSALLLGNTALCRAAPSSDLFPRPFVGSRTVSSFAAGLMFIDEMLPVELERQILAGLARTNVKSHSVADERRQAAFFSSLAVRVIAPRALRRAGYEAFARQCENEDELGSGGAVALINRSIGREHRSIRFIPRVHVAFGSSAHASTCSRFAASDDIEVAHQAGYFCARALLEPFSTDEPDYPEIENSLQIAVAAINEAVGICTGSNERSLV